MFANVVVFPAHHTSHNDEDDDSFDESDSDEGYEDPPDAPPPGMCTTTLNQSEQTLQICDFSSKHIFE